jgi:hypothetical protein
MSNWAERTRRPSWAEEQDRAAQNPKDLAATRDKKPKLSLLEHVANIAIARVMETGAIKYGRGNFRQIPIMATVYGDALGRHIGAWLAGEDLDPDSGISHIAHIGANVHVLLAAMDAGTFTDDRGPAPRTDEQQVLSDASNTPVV